MKLISCALYWQNKIFKLKAESGDAEGEESKGNTSENEEEDNKTASSDTILRDFNYKLRCMFMESNRNLKASWLETISRMTNHTIFFLFIYTATTMTDSPDEIDTHDDWFIVNSHYLIFWPGEVFDGGLWRVFCLWCSHWIPRAGRDHCQHPECVPYVFGMAAWSD